MKSAPDCFTTRRQQRLGPCRLRYRDGGLSVCRPARGAVSSCERLVQWFGEPVKLVDDLGRERRWIGHSSVPPKTNEAMVK